MRWEDLSMRERAQLMHLYVKGGVMQLSQMKKHYNAFGGPLRDEYDNPEQYYDYNTAEEAGGMYDEKSKHWASRDPRTGMILKNPKHPTFALAIREDQSSGYTPFIDTSTGRYFTLKPEEYATAPNKATLRRVNLFQGGGKTESSIKRDSIYHRRSLERFVKENPVVEGINTQEFVDWASHLAELESHYRRDVIGTTDGETLSGYNGWYGQKIPKERLEDENYQHRRLFKHLRGLFDNTITKADIEEAVKLGIGQGPLLAKYWNQGNRVNNWLRGGKDTTDGTNRTKVSEYGNDIKSEINYERYAMEPIIDDIYVVKPGDNFFDIQKRVRAEGRVYGDGRDLIALQDSTMREKLKKGLLNIGDTIKLRPNPKAARIKTSKQDYTLGNPIWHPELYLPSKQ